VGEGESNSTTKNLVLSTRNLQNFKDKHAGQPYDKRATTYSIHVLSLLNHRGWKRLILKKCMHIQDILCNSVRRIM